MNIFLMIAGTLNAIAAILHIGCIYFGAPWYRFFGAGEQMASLAEKGNITPTLITSGIITVLFSFSIYAYSAAGFIGKLPLTRMVLIAITSVYLIRGIVGFFLINNPIGRTPEFWFWSSAICLSLGIIHLIGLRQQLMSI